MFNGFDELSYKEGFLIFLFLFLPTHVVAGIGMVAVLAFQLSLYGFHPFLVSFGAFVPIELIGIAVQVFMHRRRRGSKK